MSQTDEARDGGAPTPTHVVACYTCKAPFDAVSAGWCQCLARRCSLVCPVCRRCFCQAPQSYKQGFWEGAPQELWDRAEAEHRPVGDLPENPDPELVEHPLVLIVDDEKDIRRVAFAVVTGLGYHAVVASDGEEGIELATRYRPELILTDAFMPKLDGREMCRRIKTDPQTAAREGRRHHFGLHGVAVQVRGVQGISGRRLSLEAAGAVVAARSSSKAPGFLRRKVRAG